MKKNVYSLVLSEDVVAAADLAAYRQGLSRSAFIDRVLAEHLCCTTPEMQMREIFTALSAILDRSAILTRERSDRILSLRSSLAYKYNPTVRYSVALTGKRDPIGELSVSFRTQNVALLQILSSFYDTYYRAEAKLFGSCETYISDGKWCRPLRARGGRGRDDLSTADAFSRAIADYVRCFDAALKAYFREAAYPAEAVRAVETIVYEYLRSAEVIL